MIDYARSFREYLKCLKEQHLDLANFAFKKTNTLSRINSLRNLIAKIMNHSNFGKACDDLSPEDFLFYANVGDRDSLISLLNDMLNSQEVSPVDKENAGKLLKILGELNRAMDKTPESKAEENEPSLSQSIDSLVGANSMADKKEISEEFLEHCALRVNYAQFMAQRLGGKLAPKSRSNPVSPKFSSLSRKELVAYFAPEMFYSLSKQEVAQLLQAVANDYCKANGIGACPVDFAKLKTTEKSVVMGEYSPAGAKIEMNNRFLENWDEFRSSGNAFMPYQLLSTVIHEAQHHVQAQTLDKRDSELSQKERLVKKALIEPQSGDFADYLTSPEELDARDCALGYLEECAKNADSTQAEQITRAYCVFKKREDEAGKNPLSPEKMAMFGAIYGDSPFARSIYRAQETLPARSEMISILQNRVAVRER